MRTNRDVTISLDVEPNPMTLGRRIARISTAAAMARLCAGVHGPASSAMRWHREIGTNGIPAKPNVASMPSLFCQSAFTTQAPAQLGNGSEMVFDGWRWRQRSTMNGIDERIGYSAIRAVVFDPTREQRSKTQRPLDHRARRPPRSVLRVDQAKMNLSLVPLTRARDQLHVLFVQIDVEPAFGKLERRAHPGYSAPEYRYSHDRSAT
jgi:hypothetical protein